MKPLVLVIGHSHMAALHAAHAADPAIAPGLELAFVTLNGPAFSPPVDAAGALHPAIARMLAARRLAGIVALVGGNMHNALALARDPAPFDVIVPGTPAGSLPEPGARLLPAGLVRQVLARRSAEVAAILAALAGAARAPLVQLQSPPPIPSEAHLRAHPTVFAEAFARHGIAPAALRWRMWRINSALMAEWCAAHAIPFLPVPEAMLDADGMLAPAGWGADPTHANAAYGAAALRQALAHLGLGAPR